MITLGLVGGVASGKSAAARLLAEHVPGTIRIDGDRLGHQTLEIPAVKTALVGRWGESILNAAGEINRSAVAKIVFDTRHPDELHFLESKTHPHIRKEIREQMNAASAAEVPLVIIDAALLLETGWGDFCDMIIFVDTPAEVRQARALATRYWDAEEFKRREAAQWSVEKKRAAANIILNNSGSETELAQACIKLWDKVKDL